MTSLDNILFELEDSDDLSNVLRIIYSYYLSDAEKEFYDALVLHTYGKKQSDIGVLLGLTQVKVARKIAALKKKINSIGNLLSERKHEIYDMMLFIKKNCSKRDYLIISSLLAGIKYHQISKQIKKSDRLVYNTMHLVEKDLPGKYRPLFRKCIETLT